MGEDLGVGKKQTALGLESSAQRAVVLDDAVVDQRDVSGLVEMRVGIGLGGWSVGGPAGVGDAGAASAEALGRLFPAGLLAQRGDLARGLGDDDFPVIENGDTG